MQARVWIVLISVGFLVVLTVAGWSHAVPAKPGQVQACVADCGRR